MRGWHFVFVAAMLLSCHGQKDGDSPKDDTIEEVEFVRKVEEKDNKEAPSMYDERYGTPIIEKEGKPKDDLVKDPKEDEILPYGEGSDTYYDNVGGYDDY